MKKIIIILSALSLSLTILLSYIFVKNNFTLPLGETAIFSDDDNSDSSKEEIDEENDNFSVEEFESAPEGENSEDENTEEDDSEEDDS